MKNKSVNDKPKRIRRKRGEHRFADCGGLPRCITCGCDEDDAFVGGEECSYGKNWTGVRYNHLTKTYTIKFPQPKCKA